MRHVANIIAILVGISLVKIPAIRKPNKVVELLLTLIEWGF